MKRALVIALASVAIGFTLNSTAFAQGLPAVSAAEEPAQEQTGVIGAASVITIRGEIVSVDEAKKLVTFKGPRGNEATLEVQNPYNLASIKAGDPFVARFYEVVSVRKKKPGESIPAASLKEGIMSAQPGETPGAAAGQTLQLVATVEGIDKKNKTVTLKGPEGNVETVAVANPENLERVSVGEEIVITLSRAVAISLAREPEAGS